MDFRGYKDKFPLTPTNFSIDYGKSPRPGIFDTSNVLNWLQSPTGNGLFSPGGGLGSLLNTPKGPIVPRTPGTPTISTSFFFSDAADLSRTGDNTPKRDAGAAKSPMKDRLSNIICISPLARSRHGLSNATKSPINYNDIFASPNPLLDDSPMRAIGNSGQNLKLDPPGYDAANLAHRDLMQDEDLSVLLCLAGGNTPRGAADRSMQASGAFRGSNKGDESGDRENLPGLQLPVIGDQKGESTAARLSRKPHTRDIDGERDGFTLGIRKSGSGAQAELFPDNESTLSGNNDPKKHPGNPDNTGSAGKPPSHPFATHNPYPPRPDMYGYPTMPPQGMRPAGRMSVVVGGPPPSKRASKSSTPAAAAHHMPAAHRRPSYTPNDSYPPPGMSYPPPPGHYPPHPAHMTHPYHAHYGAPPRHHPHAPPPSHMPMYGAQHGPGATKLTSPPPGPPGKKPKTPKSASAAKPAAKRPSTGGMGDVTPARPPKKAKKSPSAKKHKGKSPQLTDRADRQKAAANIAAVNAASGGKNDKAAALAAAILRGVTMRPSGKWVSHFSVMMLVQCFDYLFLNSLSNTCSSPSFWFTASSTLLCRKVPLHWCV